MSNAVHGSRLICTCIHLLVYDCVVVYVYMHYMWDVSGMGDAAVNSISGYVNAHVVHDKHTEPSELNDHHPSLLSIMDASDSDDEATTLNLLGATTSKTQSWSELAKDIRVTMNACVSGRWGARVL